jgi:coenzyme F420-0:L-glutamate ligase/coenzyme F420-1:gamma-L-glutamate ligase
VPPFHDPPVPRPPTPGAVTVIPLTGVPEVEAGADLAALLLTAVTRARQALRDGDCLVVSSKVVSKALGLAADGPRGAVVDAVTRRVVAERRGPGGLTRIVEAEAGPVMAAGGVDASNTGPSGSVLVLPEEPDAEAARLREELLAAGPGGHAALGVVLSDTAGRPWRAGQTDFALGAAGLVVIEDLRGGVDADGRPLAVTARALADEVAAAADLVKGKTDGVPAALVRGLPRAWFSAEADGARTLVRTGPADWFALGHVEAVRSALGVAPGSEEAEEVGISSTTPEGLGDRVARVVALALLDVPDGSADVAVHDGDHPEQGGSGDRSRAEVCLGAPDPYDLGRLVARVEVAAASEALRSEVTTRSATSTTVLLRPT